MATVPTQSHEPVTRDVAARGARIRYLDAGEPGQGRTIVLLHDYLSSHLAWSETISRLSPRFRVIAPDFPGFGESEKPPPARYAYGFDAFAESIVDLIAAIGVGRVTLCGHALGAAVALTIAANHPHVVEGLVLVDALVYPPAPDLVTRVSTLPVIGPFAFKQLFGRGMFRQRFRDRVHAEDDVSAPRVEYLFEVFNAPAAREAAYATLLSTSDTRPLTAKLPRVSAPTLVVWGRADRIARVDDGRRLARELRDARLEVIDCGHSPHEEAPDKLAAAVAAFVAGRGA